MLSPTTIHHHPLLVIKAISSTSLAIFNPFKTRHKARFLLSSPLSTGFWGLLSGLTTCLFGYSQTPLFPLVKQCRQSTPASSLLACIELPTGKDIKKPSLSHSLYLVCSRIFCSVLNPEPSNPSLHCHGRDSPFSPSSFDLTHSRCFSNANKSNMKPHTLSLMTLRSALSPRYTYLLLT